jgi:hypothetical protein
MREVNESLSTYLARLEKVTIAKTNGLILGRHANIPVLLDGDDEDILKTPIGYPLFQKNMFYIVQVPAGKHVTPHSHDEDVFRVLISGDLTVNGVEIGIGEWFVVPASTPYEILTRNGYQVMSGYTSNCRTRRMEANTHLELEPREFEDLVRGRQRGGG